MERKVKNMKIELLTKESLTKVNGGGEWWVWLGKTVGNVQNAIEDAWEGWKEDCAYNAGMAKI
jgi:hypothetical protein